MKNEIKIFKEYVGEVVKEIDDEARTLTITASTGERDRVNEAIPPEEWKLDNYNKNPVILWAHTYDAPPVAKALWTKADKSGLKQKIQFAKTDFATDIFNLYKDGFLNAFSVGFRADRDKEDERIFRNAELLEVSCVPVPCNANALAERSLDIKTLKSKEAVELVNKIFIVKDVVHKPEETEDFIHIRVKDPALFEQDSFRTIYISKSQGIQAVIGKLKGEDKTTVQKYIFEKAKGWTMESAQKWVDDHKDAPAEEEKIEVPAPKPTEIDNELKIIALQGEIKALKEGRVLSTKNRELIGKCVEALRELLDATDPEADKTVDNPKKYVIIIQKKNEDVANAENLTKTIDNAIKQINVAGLIRGELKRLKGEVE